MEQKELWEKSLVRFKKILDLTCEIDKGIDTEGNPKYGIISSPFCDFNDLYDKDCEECPWGKVFGICGDVNSQWDKIYMTFGKLENLLEETICEIERQIEITNK